jgi:ubiquinone/menaquinone biosynthesis C-methylase UbiE
MSLVHTLQRHARLRAFIYNAAEPRAVDTIGHFKKYLRPGEKLLDVGTGMGNIAWRLQQLGYPTTPLDIEDVSFTPNIQPVLYDGKRMPFKDKVFDSALILTVLHHIPREQQIPVIKESLRVAKRLIIIEDVHYNWPHKLVTMFLDSLLNLEFAGHPHSNKNDDEWRALFTSLGLTITAQKHIKSFLVLRHRMYILEPTAASRT